MNWYRIDLTNGTAFYELDVSGETLNSLMSKHPNACLKINRCIMLISNNNQAKPGFVAVQPKQLNPMFACCQDGQEFLCLNKVISFGLVDVENEHWDKIYNNVFAESNLVKPNLKLIVPD
jgi:hypothetical protein